MSRPSCRAGGARLDGPVTTFERNKRHYLAYKMSDRRGIACEKA